MSAYQFLKTIEFFATPQQIEAFSREFTTHSASVPPGYVCWSEASLGDRQVCSPGVVPQVLVHEDGHPSDMESVHAVPTGAVTFLKFISVSGTRLQAIRTNSGSGDYLVSIKWDLLHKEVPNYLKHFGDIQEVGPSFQSDDQAFTKLIAEQLSAHLAPARVSANALWANRKLQQKVAELHNRLSTQASMPTVDEPFVEINGASL